MGIEKLRRGYTPFILNIDKEQASFRNVITELNAANRAAIQQKNAVMQTLSNFDLNPEDYGWRDAYAEQIENELHNKVIGGSYAKALPTVIELAGKVASNPELLARQKANKEYQARKNIVDSMVANGKLPDRIAQQWFEENPYKFNPIINENGKVIGAQEWRPNWTPIEPIDMTLVYSTVAKLAGEESGSSQNVRFVDEQGNPVSNPNNGMYAMEIKIGNSWSRLPASKLKRLFTAALDQIPGAKETFEQEYNNRLWQFSKTEDEKKGDFYNSDIIDNQGNKRTFDEYVEYKSDPIFAEMAYNRVHSTIDYSPNSAYLSGKMQQATDKAEALALIDAGEQNGPGMEIPLTNMLTESSISITRILKDLLDLYKNTNLYKQNGRIINGYINRGDYIGLADFLDNRQRFIINRDDKLKLQNYIRLLKSEGTSYNNLTSGLEKEELDTVNAYISMKTGIPIPNADKNSIANDLARRRNKLFSSFVDNNAEGKPNNRFYLALATDETYNRFLTSLNLTEEELKIHGIKVRTQDGKKIIDIYKNTDILAEIGEFVRQEESRDATRNWTLDSGFMNFGDKNVVVGKYDYKIPVLRRQIPSSIPTNLERMFNEGITHGDDTQLKELLMDFSPKSNYYNNLENKVTGILKNHGKTMVSTPTITAWGSANSYVLQDLAKDGRMKISDLKSSDDTVTEHERDLIKTGLGHIGDFRIWRLNPETKNMELVKPNEEEDVQKALNSAVADDKFTVHFTISDTDKGHGHMLSVPAGTDKEGKSQGIRTAEQYYIEGLADSEVSNHLINQPDLIYNREYHRARALKIPIKDVTGKPIIYDAGNEEIERNKFIAVKAMNDIYKIIETTADQSADNRSKTGRNVLIPEAQYEAWAKNLLISSGYDPNSTEGIRAKTKLMDKFRTQFYRIYNAKE